MCRPNKLNCFNCNKWFKKMSSNECKICGEIKCPFCNYCLCDMSIETKRAVIAMIKSYENYIDENFDLPKYDFSKHMNLF